MTVLNHDYPQKIVSGGQTGVDRGALDAALELGVPHGGWCPKGRLAEDGAIRSCYDLKETGSDDYAERTERNVVDSDGTLVLYDEPMTGGTALTVHLAKKHRKPCLTVALDAAYDIGEIRKWLAETRIAVLNVAGPRESTSSGVCRLAKSIVMQLLTSEHV